MAQLFQLIDIQSIKTKYNLNYLIETGTGDGETLSYVRNLNFNLIQSCEIEQTQYDRLKERFTDPNIKIWKGDSKSVLQLMMYSIDGPALFFLDAHFPGTGYVRSEFKSNQYSLQETLPLEQELEVISNWKHSKDSVIVVDDLRIYKSGNYEAGDWPEREQLFGQLNYDFLYSILNKTHDVTETLSQQGGIIYTPKK